MIGRLEGINGGRGGGERIRALTHLQGFFFFFFYCLVLIINFMKTT